MIIQSIWNANAELTEKRRTGFSGHGAKKTIYVLLRESCAGIDHLTNDPSHALQVYIMKDILVTVTKNNVNQIALHNWLVIL